MKRRGRIKPVKEYLSPDLCREILCRLPVKDLLRFRLVCKIWCSIIDDPQFVSLHLTRYKNNVERSRLFVSDRRSREDYPVIRRSDTFRKIGVCDTSLLGTHEIPDIVGYINGLFVLWIHSTMWADRTMTVWNPSIRRHLALPPFPWSQIHSSQHLSIGSNFGFDPLTNDYKVVSVCQQATFSRPVPTSVYLYTFGSPRWRVISSGHHFPKFWSSTVFAKGIVYWATEVDLFLFDVGKETFSRCNVPDYGSIVDKSIETIPVIFGESLAFLNYVYDHYCLWVKDQYANWIKLHTVQVDRCSFMCLKTNGEMLLKTKKGLCSYNMNTQEMKVLAKSYRGYLPEAFEYVESLLWPMGV